MTKLKWSIGCALLMVSLCALYPFYTHTVPQTTIRLKMHGENPPNLSATRRISSDIGDLTETFRATNGVLDLPQRTLRANFLKLAKEYIVGLVPHQSVVPGMRADIEVNVPAEWDFLPAESGCEGAPIDTGDGYNIWKHKNSAIGSLSYYDGTAFTHRHVGFRLIDQDVKDVSTLSKELALVRKE